MMATAEDAMKILLIEHDPAFTHRVRDMIAGSPELEAEMQSAPNLTSGLSELTTNRYDVVLFDVSVPDGAGLANVAVIRAEAPQLPIIAAGDVDNEAIALEAVQAGAQDYLVKGQLTSGWLERSLRYAIERHRLDVALLTAEEKYHSIFDHLVEGIFRTTPAGRYLMANAALARIYGYASPEDLMQSLTDIGRSLYVKEGRRDEFVRLMQEHDTLTGFESQIYRKDGTVIWISENCRAVRDSRGGLLYYEGTVEDITLRRQVEENLRNSEALYHSLVETLPQNIFRKDLQGRFTFANQQFCHTLGRSLDDIVGKTDFDFFPRELAEKYQRDDQFVLQTGRAYETVEEHQPPGSGKMFVQVVKTPLHGAGGQAIGLQAIFWDITQQRLADEKIRRVNALLAQSRKELRTRNLQMEDNLKMAREVQVAMLPQQYPVFPRSGTAAESAFQFTHRYLPASSVGGDFFTVSALSDNEAAVFICDVAGHGVRSALITAMVRALVEELKPLAADPGQFLSKLNSDLHAILKHAGSSLLTTAFYLVADWSTGTLRYASAGHPKPLHVHRSAQRVTALAESSDRHQPVLGLFPDATYESSTASLAPNDLIVLFTDGLYEVQNREGTLYSQALLLECFQELNALAPAELFDQVLDRIRQFSQGNGFSDDVCLVGVELSPRVGAPPAQFP